MLAHGLGGRGLGLRNKFGAKILEWSPNVLLNGLDCFVGVRSQMGKMAAIVSFLRLSMSEPMIPGWTRASKKVWGETSRVVT